VSADEGPVQAADDDDKRSYPGQDSKHAVALGWQDGPIQFDETSVIGSSLAA
jgi:hypothetical protein